MNSQYNPYEVIVEMAQVRCPFCGDAVWALLITPKHASETKCLNCHSYLWSMENFELTEQFIEKFKGEQI